MEGNYAIYSDESNQTASKFGSICLISGSKEQLRLLEEKIKFILEDSDVNEFKFGSINSAKMIHCGTKLIDEIMIYVLSKKIRVDVIIWSKEERANVLPDKPRIVFERMYYHILNNVIGKKWREGLRWNIYPDRQSLINWKKMKEILENTGRNIFLKKDDGGAYIYKIICKNNVCKIEQSCSKEKVLCQIADLFAGMASSSHIKKSHLTLKDNKQRNLDQQGISLTNRELGKIRIITHLRRYCKESDFKIDFSPNKGIRTLDPQTPINFWVFEHRMQRNKNKQLTDYF